MSANEVAGGTWQVARHTDGRALRARHFRSTNHLPFVTCYLLVAAMVLSASGCSWFTDFKQQPKIDPWETVADTIPFRGNPQNSVPVYGTAAPGYEFSRTPLPGTIDSMAGIPNPVAPDARSLNNGRINFQINCAVCHGPLGHGDGPATKFGMVPMPLTSDHAKGLTDGYIFGMIRNGRGLMPTYNRIEEPDRWDIVNYVRSLQGKYGTAPDTTHGRPGENGTTVPGPSISAPTRPAPYYHYIYPQAGAPPAGTVAAPAAAAPNAGPARDTAARRAPDSTTQRRRP